MLDKKRPDCFTGEEKQDREYWLERMSKIERIQRGIQQRISDLEKGYFIVFMDRVKGVICEEKYKTMKKEIRKKITYYENKLKIMNSEYKSCDYHVTKYKF